MAFREDLTKLQSWTDDNGLTYNTSKCEVVRDMSQATAATQATPPLQASRIEKDRRVLVPYNLKSYTSYDKNAYRVNLTLVTLKELST